MNKQKQERLDINDKEIINFFDYNNYNKDKINFMKRMGINYADAN